ncbi:hypothetical protein [Noviherbaspirillum sp.]|jgi:hypothetical protein|uniref:hypothetical protein n=1 Tax=Noviherbaspirillum sp. TaxID=1926288 RepID=UPI0025D7BB15|nr:hypothetical protein [Noviherbaspirillum sp.]
MTTTNIRFTVRRKGGRLGGQTLEHAVPEFDWTTFKNLPNADAFVKKAYFSAAQKIVRELHEGKNGTELHHLQSVENLMARSLKFTREEIEDWCESREWAKAAFQVESDKAINFLKQNLPLLSTNESAFPGKLRARAAEIVAEVADVKADPVADYLFVKLTQEQTKDDLLLILL